MTEPTEPSPSGPSGPIEPSRHHEISPAPELGTGRSFTAGRRVRLGDVAPSGRLRLDALARYLQDIANDDAFDAIGDDAAAWVVRRTTLVVHRLPALREPIELRTWGSGVGARWAERRTSVLDADGVAVEASSLWVHIDLATGRPARLPASFEAAYGSTVGLRKVTARTIHPDRPAAEVGAAGRTTTAWPVRHVDLDVIGHVNNAVYWAMVEERAAAAGLDLGAAGTTVEATIEYRGGIAPDDDVSVVAEGGLLWVFAGPTVAATCAFALVPAPEPTTG